MYLLTWRQICSTFALHAFCMRFVHLSGNDCAQIRIAIRSGKDGWSQTEQVKPQVKVDLVRVSKLIEDRTRFVSLVQLKFSVLLLCWFGGTDGGAQ